MSTASAPPDARPATRRLLTILHTVARFRLDELIEPHVTLPWHLRLALLPMRAFPKRSESTGERLRLALESLGPVFVKFGQMLSTRRDLLPPPLADELALLQDQVAPFPGSQAHELVARALGQDLKEVFSRFSSEPLASASVAQVHTATLRSGAEAGTEVVVKIVRPELAPVIRADVAILRTLARTLETHSADARRLHPSDVVADYERTILDELDMTKEAANTVRLRQDFAESPLLYVPRVYQDYCRANVLVIERVSGVPIADIDELKRLGTNLPLLAARGVETFFTQVFETNFFHADMHPGNIFVDVTDPDNPSYIAIDCAIVGSLTEQDQDYLARNLLAFFHQDYAAIARLHLESGWIPPDTDAQAFEAVIRELCEPIFAKPLAEISFGEFLVDLFNTASDFQMEVQPQLVLLQKTLLYIEGLGRTLYPELDLWETAQPFMERWMAERLSPARTVQSLMDQAPRIVEQLPQLPELVASASFKLRSLENQLVRAQRDIAELNSDRIRSKRRSRWALGAACAALLIMVVS
ncbi:MAG: ubiquinone biosynthesis regulatory protein kinase UbiB [Pseudomonadales bacterium]